MSIIDNLTDDAANGVARFIRAVFRRETPTDYDTLCAAWFAGLDAKDGTHETKPTETTVATQEQKPEEAQGKRR